MAGIPRFSLREFEETEMELIWEGRYCMINETGPSLCVPVVPNHISTFDDVQILYSIPRYGSDEGSKDLKEVEYPDLDCAVARNRFG